MQLRLDYIKDPKKAISSLAALGTNTYQMLKGVGVLFSIPSFLLLSFLVTFFLSCRNIDVSPNLSASFLKVYGGKGTEISSKMLLLDDGSFLMIGTSSSVNDTTDIYLIKANDKGNKIWERFYGTPNIDTGVVVRKTVDNSILMMGTTYNSISRDANIYLAKIAVADGNVLWQKTIKNSNGKSTYGYDISVGADGSIYVIGGTDTLTNDLGNVKNVYIAKLNADGTNKLTIPTLGLDSRNNLAENIVETNSNQVAGVVNTFITIDVNGQPQFQSTPIFMNIRLDVGRAILQVNKSTPQLLELDIQNAKQMKKTADGGYIVVGTCIKNGLKDLYLMKLNADFEKIDDKGWFQFVAEEGNSEGYNVLQCADGGYVACGSTFTNKSQLNILVVRTDAKGNVIFRKSFGGTGNDFATDIVQTSDGGFAIFGTLEMISTPQNRPVMTLLKITANGELEN